jgi:hypothetical protein
MIARVAISRAALAAHMIAATVMLGIFTPDYARAQLVPTVDIAATCRAASIVTVSLLGSTGTDDFKICMEGENKARETITKDWSAYAASDGVGCIQPRVYLPTYVEWLTCIEMNKTVREARKTSGVPVGNIETGGTVTLPRVNWLGGY